MNILVFRSGLLGDTLVAVPALSSLRRAFPQARICYVHGGANDSERLLPRQVLDRSGLVDGFEDYYTGSGALQRIRSWASLLGKLRQSRWDLAIVLEEPHWPVHRNRFARLCGAPTVIGTTGQGCAMPKTETGALMRRRSIVDSLVQVLKPLSIPLPPPQEARFSLQLGPEEKNGVDQWLARTSASRASKPWIGMGFWSNMPVKRWPLDRYEAVVNTLIKEFDATPFLLGGASEKSFAQQLIRRWGRGHAACGELNVREGIELLGRCSLYLGNDTGVMHMAVAAGIRCVAIFCSHHAAGRWEPYGQGHVVFRTALSCEGCGLRDCLTEDMRCIKSVAVQDVARACSDILRYDSSVPKGQGLGKL